VKYDNIKQVYLLGIGGIGMSALARYFNAEGKIVKGYDKTRTALTDELVAENMEVFFDENTERLETMKLRPENTLVIYTPAVPLNHREYLYFLSGGFSVKKRSEVLGIITENSFTIAVAGTHGKTTTSSLIAHILRSSGVDCSAFLGGITQNYHTNLLIGKNLGEKGAITVVEADEYDRSFLSLHPDIAIITSIDADHLDIYGDQEHMHESYNLFAKQIKKGGTLIAKSGTEKAQKQVDAKIISYSLRGGAAVHAENITISGGYYRYEIKGPAFQINDLLLGLPGSHNVENSVAAVVAARIVGVKEEKIREALASFKGVKRRFEYQIKSEKLVFIDDYAHHPEELRACILSIRELYPDKKLTGVFQPHLFTRTRDFADGFAQSLSLLDEVVLLEIYPAREQPIAGVNSQMLLDRISSKSKMLCSKQELVSELKKRNLEILLTVGAGDIDMLVEPIKNALLNN
jgi:UDP-N-acetylmuramate--alanine ligase